MSDQPNPSSSSLALALLTNSSGLQSKHFAPDRPIVQRIVREGYTCIPSVFQDDEWDLLPGIGQESLPRSSATLNFTLIQDPMLRLTAKEYMLAALTHRIAGEGRFTPIKLTTGPQEFLSLKAFIDFVVGHGQVRLLSEVTQELLSAFSAHIRSKENGVTSQIKILRVPKKLWSYRQYLSYDGLPFEPWPGQKASDVVGGTRSREENSTPRIPEEVMGPTLRWAIRYVEDFSDEILDQVSTLRTRRASPWGTTHDLPLADRLQRWIDQRRAEGRGIPRLPDYSPALQRIRNSGPSDAYPANFANRSLIAQEAKIDHTSGVFVRFPKLLNMLRDAIEELGWERVGRVDAPSVFRLHGHVDGNIVGREYRYLMTACYVVISYLSGMRDSEVHSLRFGCCYTKPTRDGLRNRFMVRGRVYKGRDQAGEEAEWVVCELVMKAVRVLERMADLDGRGGKEKHLFVRLAHMRNTSQGFIRTMNEYLDQFRDHVTNLAHKAASQVLVPEPSADAGAPGEAHQALTQIGNDYPVIPEYDGAPWHFQSRMFRRTLAWYIANRPFGIIAGALQFKHVGIATFEGYAGTSRSGFRQEIEAEMLLKKTLDLVDNYQRATRTEPFGGGGGDRIQAELLQIAEELGEVPGRVVDEARLRALLLQRFTTLVPGVLNDCAFAPAQALCLAGVPLEERDAPLVRLCDPIRCTNSYMTGRHLPLVELAIENANQALKTRSLPVLQVRVLRRERDRYVGMRDALVHH